MPFRFNSLSYKDFLNPFYAKAPILDNTYQNFLQSLESYQQNLLKNHSQNEDALVANALKPFLESLGFTTQVKAKQKGKSEIDLAITQNDTIEVIFEVKKPNSNDFFTPNNPNCKALHECILYYLRERKNANSSLKFIIITDCYHFYIFSAKDFEKLFHKNKEFQKLFENFQNPNSLFKGNTDEFYKEAKSLLDSLAYAQSLQTSFNSNLDSNEVSLNGLFWDLTPLLAPQSAESQESKNNPAFLTSFKIFNKDFLLDCFNPNDANDLNKKFYDELLYILGLTQSTQNGKAIIQESKESKASEGTLFYAIKSKLTNKDFEYIIQYIILWLNRILFLKLIESNLVRFNNDTTLKFLNYEKIDSFDKLNELFFEILAKDYTQRNKKSPFTYLPYLNSSLFQKQPIENTLQISNLNNDLTLKYYKNTQIKDTNYKPKHGEVKLLEYLFTFLNSFDFGHISTDEEHSITHKDLINYSVLGSVFERLNGYKEGSYYTPAYITYYMCKQSLEKVVLDKFNAFLDSDEKSLESLSNLLFIKIKQNLSQKDEITKQAREILLSIKICDPAVGSGYFLATALNVMLEIFSKLNLLGNIMLEIQNDEIFVRNSRFEIIEYKRPTTEQDPNHKIQKELFTLKKQIIESCLFGVDINPNSCEIARLRLWIELLKHSYYTLDSSLDKSIHALQTLPNIDINIKCGNSLVSYFEVNENNSQGKPRENTLKWLMAQDTGFANNFKEQIKIYKESVNAYKEALKDKKELINTIDKIKELFKNTLLTTMKDYKNLKKNLGEFVSIYGDSAFDMETPFGMEMLRITRKQKFRFQPDLEHLEPKKLDPKGQKLLESIHNDFESLERIRTSQSFEWRFAFPEVLDNNGDFLGFDLVIGNPPYISAPSQLENTNLALQRQTINNLKKYKSLYQKWDLYIPFIELGISKLCKENAICAMIIPYPFTNQLYAKVLRDMITTSFNLYELADLQGIKVFDSAVVTNCIIFVSKQQFKNKITISNANENLKIQATLEKTYDDLIQDQKTLVFNTTAQNRITNKHQNLNTLGDFCYISKGMVLNADEKTAKGEFKKDDLISNVKDKIHCKEYIEAKDIEKYAIKRIRYLEYNTPRSPSKLSRPTFPQLYENEKILINKIGNIKAIFDKNNIFCDQTNRICILWKDLKGVENNSISGSIKKFSRFSRKEMEKLSLNMNLKYILGILNSKYSNMLLNNIRGLGNIDINPEYLKNIPIPKIDSTNKALSDEVISLVEQILDSKAKDPTTDTKELESKIDFLVYKLYHLTNDEIKIIENKE
ncbi:MAG: Eco57I restriction-modification methylase domain-containing protein [Helicobacter sp.]|uniref:type IIG restriction enzyme/methyltransferase n=1 Tax=Helicobacter sp. TaxID=218 RepID=UPI002A7FE16E|nr:DNA methyltransferase [Helicobacter sp.]MDY4426023.1 Eco57I restriction-modification methylase domain-containing protein [Helicobacter sp.]